MRYLDCGCAITDDGDRVWCPTCISPIHQPDWRTRAENAETEIGNLLIQAEKEQAEIGLLNLEIEKLKSKMQAMGDILADSDYVCCECCEEWHECGDVVSGEYGTFCIDCYESWQWQCEKCSYRMENGQGETCPNCGHDMVKRNAS